MATPVLQLIFSGMNAKVFSANLDLLLILSWPSNNEFAGGVKSSNGFARKVLNPTCGSWWILQVQPTKD